MQHVAVRRSGNFLIAGAFVAAYATPAHPANDGFARRLVPKHQRDRLPTAAGIALGRSGAKRRGSSLALRYFGAVAADPDDRDVEALGLLEDLQGQARQERTELISWLLARGFDIDQIRSALSPMLLPANRAIGDDGTVVSSREISESSGVREVLQIDLDTLKVRRRGRSALRGALPEISRSL
jgi:hypothetical protein